MNSLNGFAFPNQYDAAQQSTEAGAHSLSEFAMRDDVLHDLNIMPVDLTLGMEFLCHYTGLYDQLTTTVTVPPELDLATAFQTPAYMSSPAPAEPSGDAYSIPPQVLVLPHLADGKTEPNSHAGNMLTSGYQVCASPAAIGAPVNFLTRTAPSFTALPSSIQAFSTLLPIDVLVSAPLTAPTISPSTTHTVPTQQVQPGGSEAPVIVSSKLTHLRSPSSAVEANDPKRIKHAAVASSQTDQLTAFTDKSAKYAAAYGLSVEDTSVVPEWKDLILELVQGRKSKKLDEVRKRLGNAVLLKKNNVSTSFARAYEDLGNAGLKCDLLVQLSCRLGKAVGKKLYEKRKAREEERRREADRKREEVRARKEEKRLGKGQHPGQSNKDLTPVNIPAVARDERAIRPLPKRRVAESVPPLAPHPLSTPAAAAPSPGRSLVVSQKTVTTVAEPCPLTTPPLVSLPDAGATAVAAAETSLSTFPAAVDAFFAACSAVSSSADTAEPAPAPLPRAVASSSSAPMSAGPDRLLHAGGPSLYGAPRRPSTMANKSHLGVLSGGTGSSFPSFRCTTSGVRQLVPSALYSAEKTANIRNNLKDGTLTPHSWTPDGHLTFRIAL